jgi:transposase-like protein
LYLEEIEYIFTPLIERYMLPEFKSILDLLDTFKDEQSCIDYLEAVRWNGNPISPFDATSKVYKCSGNRYKCKNTGKYFNVKVGTFFEDTKIPLRKWFAALYTFSSDKKGISSHQLAKHIDVTQKTAWFILHRLRFAFDTPDFKKELTNIVEVDETFMGGQEKNKHEYKKTKGTQGRSTKTKKPILGMMERDGNVQAVVVENTQQNSIQPIIEGVVGSGTHIMTDEWQGYRGLKNTFKHSVINHGAKEFVNGMAHTNNIECFWSHLKRTIDGTYHSVSWKHLQSYVNESTLRYNTREYATCNRFQLVLNNMDGRLTYYELTGNGK